MTERKVRTEPVARTHSRAYHDYYSGYAERYVLNENGRRCIERVYVGSYYVQKQSEGERIRTRILFFLLLALAICSFIFSASLETSANISKGTILFQAGALLSFFFLSVAFISYLPLRSRMLEREYRSSHQRLVKWSRIALFCVCAFELLTLCFFLTGKAERPLLLRQLLAETVSLVSCFLLVRLEAGVSYEEVDNTAKVPEGGRIIG